MTVKELTMLLTSCNPESEIVVRDHSLDESNTEGNSYTVMEVQEGFFDGEVGTFSSKDEVDSNDQEIFGSDAVALTFERLD